MRLAFVQVSACALALALPLTVSGSESIRVRLVDGRDMTGMADARTDADALWLRREQGSVIMSSSIAWDEVASAVVNQRTIDVAELRNIASSLATKETPLFSQRSARAGDNTAHAPLRTTPMRLRSLEIVDACLVNLDRDVEPDGLSVAIAAIGEDGRPMAVRGSLEARLFGESRPNDAPIVVFPEIDRWTHPVSRRDFVDGVAVYELQFRGTAPERQFHLLPDAVLELRLGAFGQGNYSASAPVVIRQFNPLRDHRQLRYGSRFMPRELQARPPTSTAGSQDGRWIHWTW